MKILNPNFAQLVTQKETKIRGVISALVAAMPAGDRALNFNDVDAAVAAQFPALNFGRGDVHAAALALGLVVLGE